MLGRDRRGHRLLTGPVTVSPKHLKNRAEYAALAGSEYARPNATRRGKAAAATWNLSLIMLPSAQKAKEADIDEHERQRRRCEVCSSCLQVISRISRRRRSFTTHAPDLCDASAAMLSYTLQGLKHSFFAFVLGVVDIIACDLIPALLLQTE